MTRLASQRATSRRASSGGAARLAALAGSARGWLRPPRLPDPLDEARARLFHTLLLTAAGVLTLSLAASVARPQRHVPTILLVYGALYAVHAGALGLLQRGPYRVAALSYAALTWLTITSLIWFYGGISGQHTVTFIVCILIAGFCAGGASGVAFAVATVANVALVVAAEAGGWLPEPVEFPTPWDRFQSFTVAVLISGVMTAITMSRLDAALRKGRDRESELRATQRLHERRAHQGAVLGRLGQRLAEARDAAALAGEMARAVAETRPFAGGLVYALRDGALVPLARAGSADESPALAAWLATAARRLETTGGLGRAGAAADADGARPGEVGACAPEGTWTPVAGREGPLGLLGALAAPGAPVHASDALFLRTLAGMLGAALERERMEDAQRQLQKMEAVGQLSATIAHDFNNLLTGTLGAAELLREELPEHDPRQELIRDILLASDRGALLTKRLLSFTRRPRGAPGVVDLGETTRDFAPMLQRLLGEQVVLELDGADAPLPVAADRGVLDQVLLNLAVNARDALGAAGGRVRIVTRRDVADDGAATARLLVEDDGHGMDDETLRHIFDPFFTTKEQGKGTGIGLWTVREIVRGLGGSIEAESRPGSGARFWIRLPLARPEPPVEDAPAAGPPRTAATVLVVEDNELVRRTAATALRGAGHRVETAADGHEALRTLERVGAVDLVLSDVVMPGMGGLELRRALARRPGAPPILLMSGFHAEELGGPEDVEAGEILGKPFTPAQLLAAVDRALEREPETAAAAS